jgi:hypothetical protein
MTKLHERMKIKPEHFHITWEHMESSFLIFKLPKELIANMKIEVYKQFDDIVQIKE